MESDDDSESRQHKRLKAERAQKKKAPAPPDVGMLERKHGLVFTRDDELVPTKDGVKRGLYPAQTLLDYEQRKAQLRIEGARATEEKNKQKMGTSILPAKLKRICTADLKEKTEKKDPVSEAARAVEENRRKDLIYRLMMDNTREGLDLLNRYTELAYRKLEEEGLRPTDAARADDAKIWDASFRHLVQTTDPLDKRAFIWLALYISSAFVDVFCPRTDGEYLTDANHLLFFLRDEKSPFADIFDRMLVPAHEEDDSAYARIFATKFSPGVDVECFVTSATAEWIKLRPWADMDRWRATRPTEPSIELKLLLKPSELSATERVQAGMHYLREGEKVEMLTAGNGEDENE